MRMLLAAAVLLANPSVKPWPIGPGARYLPPAAPAAVRAGAAVGSLRCGTSGRRFEVHVELFAARRVVVVPAGIGVAAPLVRSGATVAPKGCSYGVRTLAPGGVVQVKRRAGLTVADLFRVWGQPLGPNRLASFRSRSPVRAYVNGRRARGPVGAIPLSPGDEIVIELGAYVAPHPFFLFPGGAS